MKKKIGTILLLLCLSFGIFYYMSLPNYRVLSSGSFSSGDERNTYLKVIVYQYWGLDETIREIQIEHSGINGIPTTLEINLYHTKWFICYGEQPFKTVKIEYNQKNGLIKFY